MGYANSVVEESLKQQKFDDCYASYLLLGRRNTDFLFQLDSEGSRSGSSLSLRAMAPGGGGGGGGGTQGGGQQPAHTAGGGERTERGGGGAGHRGVQRSISATSGNKPRRGSTGADTTELAQQPGDTGAGGEGQGRLSIARPLYCLCFLGFHFESSCLKFYLSNYYYIYT